MKRISIDVADEHLPEVINFFLRFTSDCSIETVPAPDGKVVPMLSRQRPPPPKETT